MSKKFQEYKKLDLSKINKDILEHWNTHNTFQKSLQIREGKPTFVFFEGPPSANGMPGIHHVMARSIKDIFCRYKTMKGFRVERKAGWDTHGLPVELGVEKSLGITKEDIGKKISIADYNKACRKDVMKYTKEWEDLTTKMGYWVDMHNPYITYDNRYIETLWWLLKKLYEKGLLYKGFTIQPYSPAAGTGLSTHELNQPGCYRDVKDTTIVAQFKVIRNETSEKLYADVDTDLFFMAWTTTPWTLPSNTALAVGKDITYVKVRTFNPYTGIPVTLVLAKDLLANHFNPKYKELALEDYKEGGKELPYKILAEYKGSELKDVRYEQLIPYQQPKTGDAFRVIIGDFVTTEDGTGIVHIAPSFGADDFRVAKENGIGSLTLVDRSGKFIEGMGEFSGRYVKNEYDSSLTENDSTVDVDIAVMLKKDNKAFKIEKYVHSYPHCWRTDKPVLYYPLDSWFIKTTAAKDRMIELNNTINWKPQSTGTGRFGKWLENLQDWNLSRSRYWGTPLPIWRSEDGSEEFCIGSVAELKAEIDKAVAAGFMTSNPLANYVEGENTADNYEKFDLHRPFVDDIFLVSPSGKKMKREADLIDVWFDSGAMPYAQFHFPFENQDKYPYKIEGDKIVSLEKTGRGAFPADFIAEGVDQTRGWFFTLHAIAAMLFDSVAFKNIVSNGLVLDKNGNKMSKRHGNAVDPFETIDKYGSDPLRWYMITNASPWDNLKFDLGGVDEINRKFFGTLYNTYGFFSLYANVDSFTGNEPLVPVSERPEIDRWVISLLNSLIKEVDECYNEYEPTRAGRAIQDFVCENLSNWYVRLNRKRFWGGEMNTNKIAAYQTLHTCLETVARLASPISPFYMDQLYMDLTHTEESVHLADFPAYDEKLIDKELEERMDLAQSISSMVLALRRKVSIKVRQPLQKIMVPLLDMSMADKIDAVKKLILTEVNVKELEYISDTTGILVKKIKPNFKTLGPKYGKQMKGISAAVATFTQQDIAAMERQGHWALTVDGTEVNMTLEDVEILSEDIPGWLVANEGRLTVALDVTLSPELVQEGIAREFINRIQNIRKDSGFDVTDKISIVIQKHNAIFEAINFHKGYIATQTLAGSIEWTEILNDTQAKEIEIDEETKTLLKITKIS
ncbi:MAG: isoleucine--tRNA ligase [Bacteroidota bacterium]|nr:isoleucine--tRNA ligase [Bacteroidota bacterium]